MIAMLVHVFVAQLCGSFPRQLHHDFAQFIIIS